MQTCFHDDLAYGPLVRAFERSFEGRSLPAILLTNSGTCLATNAALASMKAGFKKRVEPGQHLKAAFATPDMLAPVLQVARLGQAAQAILINPFGSSPASSGNLDLHFFAFKDDVPGSLAPAGIVAHVVEAVPATAAISAAEQPFGAISQTEQMMRASLDASRLALWNTCPETGSAWFSDQWYLQLGYTPGVFEPSVKKLVELIHPEDRALNFEAYDMVVSNQTSSFELDCRLKRADGSWQWSGITGAPVDRAADGLPLLMCGIQADITQRKIVEAQLAEVAQIATMHRNRLDRIADNTPVGMFEFRIDADGTTRMPYASETALETLGVLRADINEDGTTVFRNVSPEYLEEMREAINASMRDLTEFKMRYEVNHPQDGRRWIAVNSVPERRSDGATTWFGALYDITEDMARETALQTARDQAMQMTEQMEVLAMQDPLTGLPNRRKFDIALEARQQSHDRHQMTLIRVDLDHFKFVNDNLGHDAGDAVLIHVAKILSSSVTPEDSVYRIGGDEFSILLGPSGDIQRAEEVVMHIQNALSVPFFYDDQICRFGASFGIALRESDAISDAELNTFADVALYQAKARGRNRVEVFTADLHRHIIDNRRVAAELEDALEKAEFTPFFQPQICAGTGQIVGLETLARWHHPTRGVIAPAAFLDVAEQIRIVPLLDQMILEKTRAVLKHWQREGFVPPKISFNVSSGQLQDHAILEMARSFKNEGVNVSFELLESILLEEETDAFRHNLDALKDMGVQIEIDDFGSGHASIIGLMQADPQVLKIDKRLITPIEDSAQSQHLVTAIVGMARALGISTTAEGVETKGQADLLRELGCDVLQGYLFSRPLDPAALLSFAQAYEPSPRLNSNWGGQVPQGKSA